MVVVYVLSALIIVSAVANIITDYGEARQPVYVTKPLTMMLIIALAVINKQGTPSGYRWAVIVGLVFSLGGDVLLMIPRDGFLLGLISFLIGHICYIVAFSQGTAWATSWLLPLLLFLSAAGFYSRLRGHLGELRVPVIVYILVISAMAWRAGERWLQAPDPGTLLAASGALLFFLSDAALAVERFLGRYRFAQALVLGTYFCGQWLIALST